MITLLCIVIALLFIYIGRLIYTQSEQHKAFKLELTKLQKIATEQSITLQDSFNYRLETLIASHENQIHILQATHTEELVKHSQDAVSSSRRTMKGQAFEQFAVYCLPDINPADCRFLGSPIDYVIFRGSDGVRAGLTKTIDEIIFVEVKTGKAKTSTVQRAVRDCIRDGRVCFITHNPETGKISDVKSCTTTELPSSTEPTITTDESNT